MAKITHYFQRQISAVLEQSGVLVWKQMIMGLSTSICGKPWEQE